MGGAAKKVVETVKDLPKSAEKAIEYGVNPIGAGLGDAFTLATGKNADLLFNPLGSSAGEVGETFVDKPKAIKEAEEQAARQAEDLRNRTKAELEGRQAQEKAESEASKRLSRARRAQTSRRGGTGRSSTILTNKLGGSASQGRKTLLGL